MQAFHRLGAAATNQSLDKHSHDCYVTIIRRGVDEVQVMISDKEGVITEHFMLETRNLTVEVRTSGVKDAVFVEFDLMKYLTKRL